MLMKNDSLVSAENMLDDFLSFDTPEGYRAELIDGEIVVSPPPDGDHEDIIGQVVEQIFQHSVVKMNFSCLKGLIIPAFGNTGEGRCIPDITFAPAALRLFRGAAPWMQTADVAMVAEVTSRRAGLDRNEKRQGYAAARIPLYLLVDRLTQRATLFSDPGKNEYAHTASAAFGDKLALPEPFAFTLDTSSFLD